MAGAAEADESAEGEGISSSSLHCPPPQPFQGMFSMREAAQGEAGSPRVH